MGSIDRPPRWIKPQLTRLVEDAPAGPDWLHEIKYDGYRMHARIDGDKIQLLTRTGLDWSHRYKRTIEALHSLKAKSAYLDGELCAKPRRKCLPSSRRRILVTQRVVEVEARAATAFSIWHERPNHVGQSAIRCPISCPQGPVQKPACRNALRSAARSVA